MDGRKLLLLPCNRMGVSLLDVTLVSTFCTFAVSD
jgi:hypothetical protein